MIALSTSLQGGKVGGANVNGDSITPCEVALEGFGHMTQELGWIMSTMVQTLGPGGSTFSYHQKKKKNSKYHSILELRGLDRSLKVILFHMLTTADVLTVGHTATHRMWS